MHHLQKARSPSASDRQQSPGVRQPALFPDLQLSDNHRSEQKGRILIIRTVVRQPSSLSRLSDKHHKPPPDATPEAPI